MVAGTGEDVVLLPGNADRLRGRCACVRARVGALGESSLEVSGSVMFNRVRARSSASCADGGAGGGEGGGSIGASA